MLFKGYKVLEELFFFDLARQKFHNDQANMIKLKDEIYILN